MHMVIFGAGASYDSDPSRRPEGLAASDGRPPLANNLFGEMSEHADAMRFYPELNPVIPYLRRRDGVSVEQKLERLQGEAAGDPGRLPQIAAVRFYLQTVITHFENRWRFTAGSRTTSRC
jgi:hypothetical protein